MNNYKNLDELIIRKTERQKQLRQRLLDVETTKKELYSSKLYSSFTAFYYFFKRYVLLVLAILLVIIGITLIIYPKIVFKTIAATESNIPAQFKENYYLVSGKTISEVITNPQTIKFLDSTVENTVHSKTNNAIRVLGILFIILALSFIYIARQTEKIKQRNLIINKTDNLLKQIIQDYNTTIIEEEENITYLNSINTNSP